MGIVEWQIKKSKQFRHTRDIVAIAAEAAANERAAHADKIAMKFAKVFGFKPELGEPVRGDTYWVQGFRFGLNEESGWLVVYGNVGGRYAIDNPAEFYQLVQSGAVRRADYATDE